MHRAVELSATYNHRSPITVQVMRNRSSITVGMLRGLLDTKRSVGDKPSRPHTHFNAFMYVVCPAAHNNEMPDPCQKALLSVILHRFLLFVILHERAKLQFPVERSLSNASAYELRASCASTGISQVANRCVVIRCTRLEGHHESGYRFVMLLVII